MTRPEVERAAKRKPPLSIDEKLLLVKAAHPLLPTNRHTLSSACGDEDP